MFTTPEAIMETTPYTEVTLNQVKQAQLVIELVIGRTESEIDGARDKTILARVTTAQTIYMRDNPDITFEQIKVGSLSRGDGATSFVDDYSPFVAPLAVLGIANLSWRKSRGIKVGRMNQRRAPVDWRRD